MSNHVHLLLQTEAPLAVITKGIKGVSARKANLILGRTGKIWHDESFDHWVRAEKAASNTLKESGYGGVGKECRGLALVERAGQDLDIWVDGG